jgi:RNA polymerase sigma-32 factor
MAYSNQGSNGYAGSDSQLNRYLREVRCYPMLQPELEQQLARAWSKHGDRDAQHRLITSHLRLVAKIATKYRGYGLPLSELISEGNLGLMKAVDRFDPDRGFRLATYAMWWIRAAIQEYILRSWSLVRLGSTAEQKKLFFNLRRIKAQLHAFEETALAPDDVTEIATQLKVPEADVVSMNGRLSGSDHSLNVPLRAGSEGDGEWQDWLVDEDEGQEARFAEHEEQTYRRRLVDDALLNLSSREREIVAERRLSETPLTLEQLSHRYGISRERVRQIEGIAIDKIKKSVDSAVRDQSRPRQAPEQRA